MPSNSTLMALNKRGARPGGRSKQKKARRSRGANADDEEWSEEDEETGTSGSEAAATRVSGWPATSRRHLFVSAGVVI